MERIAENSVIARRPTSRREDRTKFEICREIDKRLKILEAYELRVRCNDGYDAVVFHDDDGGRLRTLVEEEEEEIARDERSRSHKHSEIS